MILSPKSSQDTVWITKVIEVNRVDPVNESVDSYKHIVAPAIIHLAGHFLAKNEKTSTLKSTMFKLSTDITYFFKESIVFPYVNIQEGKKGLTLSMTDYADILYHIEYSAFAHL